MWWWNRGLGVYSCVNRGRWGCSNKGEFVRKWVAEKQTNPQKQAGLGGSKVKRGSAEKEAFLPTAGSPAMDGELPAEAAMEEEEKEEEEAAADPRRFVPTIVRRGAVTLVGHKGRLRPTHPTATTHQPPPKSLVFLFAGGKKNNDTSFPGRFTFER